MVGPHVHKLPSSVRTLGIDSLPQIETVLAILPALGEGSAALICGRSSAIRLGKIYSLFQAEAGLLALVHWQCPDECDVSALATKISTCRTDRRVYQRCRRFRRAGGTHSNRRSSQARSQTPGDSDNFHDIAADRLWSRATDLPATTNLRHVQGCRDGQPIRTAC